MTPAIIYVKVRFFALQKTCVRFENRLTPYYFSIIILRHFGHKYTSLRLIKNPRKFFLKVHTIRAHANIRRLNAHIIFLINLGPILKMENLHFLNGKIVKFVSKMVGVPNK